MMLLLALPIEYDLKSESESFRLADVLTQSPKATLGLTEISSQLPVLLIDFSTVTDKEFLPKVVKGKEQDFVLGLNDLVDELKRDSAPNLSTFSIPRGRV